MAGLSRARKTIIIVAAVIILALAGGAQGTLKYFSENPSACGKCHIMQPYVNSYYDSKFLDNFHAEVVPEVKCKDCHQVTLIQQTKELLAFVTGNYETPLKPSVSVQGRCVKCHQRDETIAKIRNKAQFINNPQLSYHLTVENGKAGCYDGRAEIVTCADCHRGHETGVNYCIECHYKPFGAPRI